MKRLVLPLIAVGLLAACGSAADDSADPVAAPAATSGATSAASPTTTGLPEDSGVPVSVPTALEFNAPLVGGGDIELTTLAGRPVLLWFWAPW